MTRSNWLRVAPPAASTDMPWYQTLNPKTDRDYAWATAKLLEDGNVKITAYGFDDHFGPTQVIGSITLKK
jgi:hypothetical protein